jgi:hypothetical protein
MILRRNDILGVVVDRTGGKVGTYFEGADIMRGKHLTREH